VRSTAVNGLVVRPALVYGRSASLFAPLFGAAKAGGRVVWPGTPGGRYAVVHTDDLAELFVRVAERASLVGGKIFDAANSQTESVNELLDRLVQISGVNGLYEYRKPENRA
jgi:nucleoside-diphosphate-sugar epimerase